LFLNVFINGFRKFFQGIPRVAGPAAKVGFPSETVKMQRRSAVGAVYAGFLVLVFLFEHVKHFNDPSNLHF
jgi:hypothetical protein